MPIVKLPINVGLNKAIDEVGLKGYGAALQDCWVDEEGNVHRRPGLTLLCDLGTGAAIDGLYWWDEESVVIAISDGETHQITASDGTNAQISGDAFEKGVRVIFSNYGTDLYAANGAKILQIDTSAVTEMADADAPTTVTHPGVLDTYLLANETSSEKLHYSDVGAPTTWSANYVSAEAQTDDLVAILIENLEIYLMGKRTLEVWDNDGVTPFVRQAQGYVSSGCIAPYSFVSCGGVFYWLDQERNVVRMTPDSRTPQVISVTMNKYIQGFSTVTDALGDYIHVGGRPYYVLTFPSEEKTLVWDIIKSYWYEWGYWDSNNAEYENWLGNCHTLAIGWNFALVGDKSSGKIYKLDTTNYDDNSEILRTLIRTSHISHKTSSVRKRSNRLVFRLKKTEAVPDPTVSEAQLNYDAQTGTFTAGNTLTGATSGATATIDSVYDSGTTGVLGLSSISGTFQDDEIIYESALGSELHPDSDCDTDWSDNTQTGWAHDAVNDEYDCDGSQSAWAYIRAESILTDACFYKLVYTVQNYSAGNVKIRAGHSGEVDTPRSADATYTEYQQCIGNTHLYIYGDADFVGSVDDISCKQVTNAALANGTTADVDPMSMTVRWRDDGSSTWRNERTVSLTQIGDTDFRGTLSRLGSYYARQYEFVLSDDIPLSLISVEEYFDYMQN